MKNFRQLHRSLTLGFLLLASSALHAQKNFKINGAIKDSSQKPIAFATVSLFKATQLQEAFKSTYTNESGKYQFSNVDTGQYNIVFTHTGFSDQQQSVTVADKDIAISDISLVRSQGTLSGVTVVAKKPLVEQLDDKIIFNVENDPTTKTETAIDILRKTPFVSVDGNDNISVNGQNNFKVLLNGRETAMFAQNVKEALKGFPGALITKIEVITTPSAKYDAEGVGGVINIITKKKVVGYNGSVNTYYSSNGWRNINTNFSAKFGKVGVTMYYGAGGSHNIKGTSRMETVPFVTAPFDRRLLLGDRVNGNFWNFGNAEVSWEVDTLNTFSFYGNISGGNNKNKLHQTITIDYPSVPDSTSVYDLESRNEYPTASVGADYIKKFSKNKEKEFSIRFNGEFGNSNTFLNSLMDNQVALDRYVINNSEAKNRQYTLQSDFIQPLPKNQKIEAGLKAIMRKASSDFESLIKTYSNEDYKQNMDNTDQFRYDQNVYSAYGTYAFKVKKTTFRLGMRIEHTEINGDFISSSTKVEQAYTNLMPNIQSTTKFNNSLTMVISYSDRLQRPFIQHLNPFKNNNDPLFISFGNPDLEPQVIHSLSVQTRLNKGKTFAGITFTGSYSNNMIAQYSTFNPATGVTSTTSGNIGKELAVSANGNVSTKINKDWNVFINGNIRYNRVENKMLASQKNSGFSGNANLNSSYSFNKRFNASGYAGFYRNPVSIQTRYPLNIWYGLNVGYKLFKEKVTVSAGANNFFQKNRTYKLVTTDPVFQYTSESTFPFRGLSLSLSWNFGKLTENVSKKKGVTNDDQLSNGTGN